MPRNRQCSLPWVSTKITYLDSVFRETKAHRLLELQVYAHPMQVVAYGMTAKRSLDMVAPQSQQTP